MLTRANLKSLISEAKQNFRYHTEAHGSVKAARTTTSVFLSHSHKDKDVIEGGSFFLQKFDVMLYVDWLDETMPESTSPQTAMQIQQRIRENKKFIVLATSNACASRWVPWELGVADVIKSHDHIAILPVADSATSWAGNEYIGIYPRISEDTQGGWAVFQAGKKKDGIGLRDWLLR